MESIALGSAGALVKHQHWTTDVYPDLADRAQAVPNRQIIDKSKIIVAIFWSRFGTPTGVADSGTQEEILRAATLGRKVMVYFSDLEPRPANADARQWTYCGNSDNHFDRAASAGIFIPRCVPETF